ncbi:MAG: MCE family protein [Bacteroidetes bacterium]|nr:MCE family protein [Bacteroidota bacterium]
MANKIANNIKLGVFVIAGLLLLIFALYMIGKKSNMFGSSFTLRARFRNVDGLRAGNNVRYAGIETGTVEKVLILNDTTIEVIMSIDEKARDYIRKNAQTTIGNEGLMGNKVVNIFPNPIRGELVKDNDLLQTVQQADIGNMIGTLTRTNDNAAIIASELVETVKRINASPVLWRILSDTTLPANLSATMVGVRSSAEHLNHSIAELQAIVSDIHAGKGTAGLLLQDTAARATASRALNNIHNVTAEADGLMQRLDSIASVLQSGVSNKEGMLYGLLSDTAFTQRLSRSLNNVENGIAAFNEDMEALKHNFLLKGYFKKQARKKSQ